MEPVNMNYAMLADGPEAFLKSADFGDLEMRVLSQMLGKSIVEFKTATKTEISARAARKQWQGYASLFGLTAAQKLQMASGNDTPGGMAWGINRLARFEQMHSAALSPARRAWAKAFEDVLGVGHEFYVNAKGDRKEYLERHYTELASHDTRKGRKAAKVVAARVMYALEDEGPARSHDDYMDPLPNQGSVKRTMTGRMMGGFQNIPKSVLSSKTIGKTFDKAIMDDLVAFKPKKP